MPNKDRLEKRLDQILTEMRYPDHSRSLSKFPAFRFPETPPVATRISGSSKQRISQREHQDMYYVAEGETATVTVEVTVDDRPATAVEHMSGSLAKLEGNPVMPSGSIASVVFRDDGVAPDERARDGIVTARVPFPKEALGSFTGDLLLRANLRVGDTPMETSFGFAYTGHPPARFTGKVRETLEDGSLSLYVGVQVERSFGYVMRARLYDHDDKPVAFMTADGEYTPDTHEAKFVAFGRLLLDEGAKAPFTLRDVEGFVNVLDAHPDRLKVPTWVGPYVTRRYRADDFSDKDWMNPKKQELVDQMQKAIELAPE